MTTELVGMRERPAGQCSAACGGFTTRNASSHLSSWALPFQTRCSIVYGHSFHLIPPHRKSRNHGQQRLTQVPRCAVV